MTAVELAAISVIFAVLSLNLRIIRRGNERHKIILRRMEILEERSALVYDVSSSAQLSWEKLGEEFKQLDLAYEKVEGLLW